MSGIEPVNSSNIIEMRRNRNKKNMENAAAGVGGAGVLGTMMKNTLKNTSKATRTLTNNTKEVNTLFKAFSKNMKRFTADFAAKMLKLQNSKFWGPIVKSPAAKKVAGFLGGMMALFVLIGEGARAVDNGKIALDDFSSSRRAA